jgi:alkylation response protein AidB-like acyl-CoA dehydrogenase
VIKGLFDQGLMGIETSAEHGGSEMSFMAAIIAVEGKLCPSFILSISAVMLIYTSHRCM